MLYPPPPPSSEDMPLFSTALPALIIQRPTCESMSFDWSDFPIGQQWESMVHPPPSSSEDMPLFSTALPTLIIQRPACENMSFGWSDFPIVQQQEVHFQHFASYPRTATCLLSPNPQVHHLRNKESASPFQKPRNSNAFHCARRSSLARRTRSGL
jgi:hypothetical protein